MRGQINPPTLCAQIKDEIATLFQFRMAQSDQTEDLFQTLLPS